MTLGVWLAPLAIAATATPSLAQTPPPLPAVGGGQAQDDSGDLAKQLSNPVASLISVPFQNNIDCCFGPEEGVRYTLNIQPVIPLSIGQEWNLIIRTIVPIIHQQETVAGTGSAFGLGDTTQSFFFSPKIAKNGLVWAVGPVFLYPTGKSRLATKKWGAGPTALVLKQTKGGVTFGMLANHIWSITGDDDRTDISTTFLQPFFAKNIPGGTTLSLNTESTYDWIGKKWTVPVNVGVAHIFKFGKQPVQIGPTARYYVSSPTGGAEWGMRLTVTLLFPG